MIPELNNLVQNNPWSVSHEHKLSFTCKQIIDMVIAQFIYSQNIVFNMINSCKIDGRIKSINIYSVPEYEVKATWVSA